MEQNQIAFSFDKETMSKIAKGAMHAVVVAGLLALVDYLLTLAGSIQSNNILVIAGLAWFSQVGYQTIRQWIAGI